MLNKPPSIHSLHDVFRKHPEQIRKVIHQYFSRIKDKNNEIRAFLSVSSPLKQTFPTQKTTLSKLTGIPVAIKDNIWVKEMPCTAASKMLESFYPPDDATVVKKIKNAGGIITGKTNMDEFAMGSSTENSAFFPTRNPWNTGYVPGGSSGGSAAAVAANLSLCALGSDTGGSIRQPASFCGVVGIRPTVGLVSRNGLIGFSSSLDQIGPLAQYVEDAYILLSVIAGYDENDNTSLPVNWNDLPDQKPTKIAVLDEIEQLDMDTDVRNQYESVKKQLKKDFEVISCKIPSFKYALSAYHIIADAEASSNLSRLDEYRINEHPYPSSYQKSVVQNRTEKLGEEVKRRILMGTFTLCSEYKEGYYLHAFYAREHLKREFNTIFKQADAIFTPSTITTAFRFGERTDPLKMYYSDICTIPSALAGLPAISVSIGFDRNQMPIGMQLIGNSLSEKKLYHLAKYLEAECNA